LKSVNSERVKALPKSFFFLVNVELVGFRALAQQDEMCLLDGHFFHAESLGVGKQDVLFLVRVHKVSPLGFRHQCVLVDHVENDQDARRRTLNDSKHVDQLLDVVRAHRIAEVISTLQEKQLSQRNKATDLCGEILELHEYHWSDFDCGVLKGFVVIHLVDEIWH